MAIIARLQDKTVYFVSNELIYRLLEINHFSGSVTPKVTIHRYNKINSYSEKIKINRQESSLSVRTETRLSADILSWLIESLSRIVTLPFSIVSESTVIP